MELANHLNELRLFVYVLFRKFAGLGTDQHGSTVQRAGLWNPIRLMIRTIYLILIPDAKRRVLKYLNIGIKYFGV